MTGPDRCDRPLSRFAKLLIASGAFVVVGIAAALAPALRTRWQTTKKTRETLAVLYAAEERLRPLRGKQMLPTQDLNRGESGQARLPRRIFFPPYAQGNGMIDGEVTASETDVVLDDHLFEDELRDAWNRPFLFRRPGPLHPVGWDLYSVGPNGVDENGEGDDILVGEDFAPVAPH